MSTIFVVCKDTRQYDMGNVSPIIALTKEEKAQDLADQLTVLEDFNVLFWKKQHEEFEVFYGIKYGPPVRPNDKPEQPPGFKELHEKLAKQKDKVTQEDKLRHRELQKLHIENCNKHTQFIKEYENSHNEYLSKKEEARKKWFLENYNPPSKLSLARKYSTWDGSLFNCGDARYYFQKLELADE